MSPDPCNNSFFQSVMAGVAHASIASYKIFSKISKTALMNKIKLYKPWFGVPITFLFKCQRPDSICRVFNIYRILLIELSVLSQFHIPLKLGRRVIIARIIRSGYNLIKAWKRLASAKTLQTHFNNRIIYSQKWYFTTSKLLRSTIPKMNHFTTHSRKDRKINPPITIQYSPRPQNPQ